MAGDIDELIGKWTVPVKQWVWEYEFFPDGKVTWRDTRSQEKGVGRWSATPKLVNIAWSDSATAESWHRPITPGRQKGWYSASYFTGNYEVQKVVPAAPRGATDVDPSVANLPWERYVDAYVSVHYDINYKVSPTKSFAFSSILRATYNDGVVVEFDIDTDFSTAPMTLDQARDLIAHAKVGRSGRIEPAVLNFATTPNLWRARADALRDQDVEANAFMGMAITATAFVLSTPAMPAGAMTEAAVMSKNVMRRTLPATKVPPAPIQGGMVRLGTPGQPGNLYAAIQKTGAGVVYKVDMIVLQGKSAGVPIARSTHREMIRQAALAAKAQGQPTFKMVGTQANQNFVRHADQLAKEIGVAGSGRASRPTIGYPDYEVVLDVAKALSQ